MHCKHALTLDQHMRQHSKRCLLTCPLANSSETTMNIPTLQASRLGSPTSDAAYLRSEVARLQELNSEIMSKLAFVSSRVPGLSK